jgi:molecular chaperone GrpE
LANPLQFLEKNWIMSQSNEQENQQPQPEENIENTLQTEENTTNTPDENPEDGKDAMAELQTKLEEAEKKVLYLMADFQNLRQKAARERIDLIQTASKDLIIDLLPVLDNFEMALASMEKATDIEAVKKGVELIHQQYIGILKSKGLKAIDAKGQPFNTDEHEAITTFPAPSEELKNTVFDVVSKGYKLNDQMIRYAKVVVAQ